MVLVFTITFVWCRYTILVCFMLGPVRSLSQILILTWSWALCSTEIQAAAQGPVSQAVPSNHSTNLRTPLDCLAVVATWDWMRTRTWAMWRTGRRVGPTWCASTIAASPPRPSTSAPARAPRTPRSALDTGYVLALFNTFCSFCWVPGLVH